MQYFISICLVVLALAVAVQAHDLGKKKVEMKVLSLGMKHALNQAKIPVPQQVGGSTSFDFYVFVLQWDPSMTTDYFTIHGLWPENQDGTYPANCPGPKFNTTSIQDLIADLNEVWPSNTGKNTDFWTHEWEKHGTCSLMGEHAYFQSSIQLHDKFDVKAALAKAKIVPNQAATYTKIAISNAIDTNIGALPALKCNSAALSEIALCISKSLTLMDCPTSLGSYFSCPTNITYD